MKLKLNFISYIIAIFCLNLFSQNTLFAQYCSPESNKYNADNQYISYIYLNGVESGQDSPGNFYNDYRGNYNFDVNQDNYYDFYVYTGNSSKSDIVGAWIDWNQDGKFDNDTEFLSMEDWGGGTYYSYMYVPKDASFGNTTLRIRLIDDWWGVGLDACGDYYNDYIDKFGEVVMGEVEEHYINVVEPNSPAKIISDPISNTNLCTTTRTNYLSVETEGTVVGYQWQKLVGNDWTDIKNATNFDYTVSIPSDLNTISTSPLIYSSDFRVLVYSYDGNTEVSNPATITAATPATVSITNTLPFIPCNGTNTTLNANVGGSYTGLKWQKFDGSAWIDLPLVNYPTANTPNLALNNLTPANDGNYRCIVNNLSNCNSGTSVSASINVIVVSNFTITKQPSSNYRACVGDENVAIKLETSGTVLSYQWKKDGYILSNNPTSTTNELIISKPTSQDVGTYNCEIRYADCSGQSNTSTNVAYLNVFSTFAIVTQPVENIVCENQDIALTTVAVGNIYGYQWQKDGKNIELSENPYANSASLFLDKVKHTQSGSYRCLIDAEDCENGRNFVSTNTVLVYAKRGTEILSEVKDVTAPINGIAKLSVEAHVSAIPPQMITKIQWYKGNNPLVNNNKIAGAKSSLLSIRNLDKSDFGADYWVVVEGLCSSDTARGFVITEVEDADITISTINDVTVCEAASAVIEANVSTNASVDLEYYWLVNGKTVLPGAKYSGLNTTKLTINNVEKDDMFNEYSFLVVEKNKSTNFKESNTFKLIIKELTTINNMSDKEITVETGKDFFLFIDANVNLNNQLTYAWFKNDNNGNPQQITGENNDTLYISNVTSNDAGEYSVKVNSECDGFEFPFNVTITSAGTTNIERGNLDLNITPNPTSEILNINLSNIDYSSITITNTLGEVLFTTTNKTNLLNINVNELSLSNGIYLINVIGNKNYTGKFVVNK